MIDQIFKEISTERENQTEKFGEQNIPCLNKLLIQENVGPDELCKFYGIPIETFAKRKCDNAHESGKLTYAHIAVEELSEVISAVDPVKRREELVQLASVVVAWIEKIDRLEETRELDLQDKYDWIKQVQILAVTNELCQTEEGKLFTMSDAAQVFNLETMFEYFVDQIPPAEAMIMKLFQITQPNEVKQ